MPIKSQGYIFIFALIFLQIGVLSSSFAYYRAAWHLKQAQQFFQNKKHLYVANKLLDQAMIELPLNCLMPVMPPEKSKQQLSTWWRESACSFKPDYYLILEDLGVDACGVILPAENKQAHYYRLSLAYLVNKNKFPQFILQRTTVYAVASSEICLESSHKVFAGLQGQQII